MRDSVTIKRAPLPRLRLRVVECEKSPPVAVELLASQALSIFSFVLTAQRNNQRKKFVDCLLNKHKDGSETTTCALMVGTQDRKRGRKLLYTYRTRLDYCASLRKFDDDGILASAHSLKDHLYVDCQ